jgi:hypothetical protein
MDRWEHRTVYVSRNERGWAVQFSDGQTLEGIDTILDTYGAKGWELVSLVAHSWSAPTGQAGPYEVTAYRAVFKRKAEAAAPAPASAPPAP